MDFRRGRAQATRRRRNRGKEIWERLVKVPVGGRISAAVTGEGATVAGGGHSSIAGIGTAGRVLEPNRNRLSKYNGQGFVQIFERSSFKNIFL